MKFFVTMNMPSNQGRMIHQMIVEPTDKSVTDLFHFWAMLAKNDFIIVDEFYFVKDEGSMLPGAYRPRGPIIINSQFVGKVREVNPDEY